MRVRFSLAALLLGIASAGVVVALYRQFNPPARHSLPAYEGDYFEIVGVDELKVDRADLSPTPPWDRRYSGNPPISANTAMVLADKLRVQRIREKKLYSDFDDDESWRLISAELRPGADDRWYWLIRFRQIHEAAGNGSEFLVAVFMDGTVKEQQPAPFESDNKVWK